MLNIAILNMKGGVGKTTIAVNIAAGLATRGYRTLLIDADPQGNVGHTLNVRSQVTLREVMLDEAPVDAAVVSSVRGNLDVIVSNTAAFSLERQLSGAVQRETIMARRLRAIERYDAVVLDTSPAMNILTFNALLVANHVIVPVSMDLMAVIGARQTLTGVSEVQDLWPGRSLSVLAVLPTFVNSVTNATRATYRALETDPKLALRVYSPGIRQCLDLTYASAAHQTIWEYAPRSRAAEDFGNLLDFTEQQTLAERTLASHAS